jgi:serine/alanine adding enzyme
MITVSSDTVRADQWDAYIAAHTHASVYHCYSFKTVIEKTYGHKGHYLAAKDGQRIAGVLPLFYVKSIILGNALISLPFCDYGGILADDDSIARELLLRAVELSQKLKCKYIELRQTYDLPVFAGDAPFPALVNKEKVRMKMGLPESAEALLAGFPAKLRSQIRKPQKEGCTIRVGEAELLEDFYAVFAYNMRDLGSPVHSKGIMLNMLSCYGERCRLFVVYHSGEPVACSLVLGFRDTLANPWASFKRTSQKIAPNMLLYWEMLRYAIESGYRFFDFGRSTMDESTYKFKAQWGAEPEQLFWYRIGMDPNRRLRKKNVKNRESFIRLWRALPLPLTEVLGPLLRKQLHM